MAVRRTSRRPVTAEDLYRLRFVADPQLSPDGERVAYVVTWVDADDHTRYRSQIMLVPFDGSSPPRALTSGRQRDSSPRWCPDGCCLAFVSDRDNDRPQIFVLPLQGGEPRQVTSLKRGAGAPVWSPDGARLAFSARTDIEDLARQEGQSDEKGKSPRVKIITRVRHKADGEGFLEAVHRHLFVVDATGETPPRQITDGEFDATDPAWSPDGNLIAFTSNRERDRDLSLLNDVWLVPSSGGRPRRLTRHLGQVANPVFSPDGTRVAYLGHERGWEYGVNSGLLQSAVQGGTSTSVSGDFPDELGNAANSDSRAPFLPAPPRYTWDGRGILSLTSRSGRVEVVRFSVDGGQPEVVLGGPEREVAAFSAGRGDRLVGLVSDSTHPYEVFAVENGEERRITFENDALLETLALSAAEPFETTSSDGQTVHGWVMKPSGFSERKKWPVILEVHGGPETMYAATFMHEFQLLAARGYAVVFSNPRGSKGYGEAFNARIFADWGNQDAADCMAVVDRVSEWKWVDRTRLGLTGGSYGGFMTAWLVGHTNRFKAAVSQRGLYNFTSFYGTSDIGPWFGDYVLGGPVYEREALYRERSPLTYAPHMRTPLLLIHSESDLRCPIEQAEQLFVQLRRIGKTEVEMVRFPEESHNLSRSGRPDRRVERLERIAGWFDRFL
ncbi:MAG: S9 family peptidase [Chloroflexi bacterium]|nr:S9 family peptidase [Chloroflexota bacterium]